MGVSTATSPTPENQLIDEQVHYCKLELVEGEGEKKGRVFARGEFGHAAKPTANGRFYRHNIWESNIARLGPNLKSRKVLGELDHPTDGRTALQRASHVITDLRLEGDLVMGEAEILDTAKGRDLKAILEAGVPVGISSRGFGSTKPNREGIEEVQEDYKLVTFDFVAEPADPTAYPEAVFESAEGEGGKAMMFEGVAFETVEPEGTSKDDEPEPEGEEEGVLEEVQAPKDLPKPGTPAWAAYGKTLAKKGTRTLKKLQKQVQNAIKHRAGRGEDSPELDRLNDYEAALSGAQSRAEDDESVAPVVGSAPPGEAEMAKRFGEKVAAEAAAVPKSAEAEMSARFAEKVLSDAKGNDVSVETLRQEFADQIVDRIAALRADVEKQVRAEMAADPAVAGARAALEQVQRALLPFALTEDANALVSERDDEIRVLRSQLEEVEQTIEQHESLIDTLTGAAREAGYRYHLECLLHEDDADTERLRLIVGDVLQYDSPNALRERVEEASQEMLAFRLEEGRVQQQQTEEADRLHTKNSELAEGLERALVANRDLALQVYASERLQTHPQGAKILRMLKRSGIQSREQVDAMIEDFREPARDMDDLEAVRSRVRSRLHGGQEYLEEDTQPANGSKGNSRNYNGLGASLADLKHLAGVGND